LDHHEAYQGNSPTRKFAITVGANHPDVSIVANPEHDLPVSSATGPRPLPVSPSFGRIIPLANIEAAKNGTDAFPPS
jgi:hypothetical protein